jgi:hypothetical protein
VSIIRSARSCRRFAVEDGNISRIIVLMVCGLSIVSRFSEIRRIAYEWRLRRVNSYVSWGGARFLARTCRIMLHLARTCRTTLHYESRVLAPSRVRRVCAAQLTPGRRACIVALRMTIEFTRKFCNIARIDHGKDGALRLVCLRGTGEFSCS